MVLMKNNIYEGFQNAVEKKDASTQTFDFDCRSRFNILLKYFTLESVSNLISILIDSLDEWKSIHLLILNIVV